jgi:MarR family transcriptional regulator, temperature-dependent positive regulator of motility
VAATKSKGTITLLSQLTKVVHRKTTEELLGVRWRHFMALSVLYDQPALSQQSLCEALVTDPNNCVLLLNEMETLGYIERRRDPVDRRRHIVEMTDAGREVFLQAILAREQVEDDVLKGLDAEERRTLRALLTKALAG